MSSLTVLSLLCATASAFSPTAPLHPSRTAVAAGRRPQPVALFGAGAARKVAIETVPKPALRTATAAAKVAASSVCSVLLFAGRAYAAERLKSAPASAAAPLLPTGDVLKWGGLAAICGTAYLFRKEEVPILTETVVEHPEMAADRSSTDGASAGADGEADGSIMADLQARMAQLAEERVEEDAPADDSTDEWGTGSTAVLEPPKPEAPKPLLEDGPVVDFPVGFPLRDDGLSEPLEPQEAQATQEQIEMLERMFGTRADDA